MIALPITIFVSLGLAVFFLCMFVIQTHEGAGNPRDALMPLQSDDSVADKNSPTEPLPSNDFSQS